MRHGNSHDSRNDRTVFLSDVPKRKPTNLFLNLDYDEWPDKLVLIYFRDRAVWVYGEPENSVLIQRLNDIIHRQAPEANSAQGI